MANPAISRDALRKDLMESRVDTRLARDAEQEEEECAHMDEPMLNNQSPTAAQSECRSRQ